MIKVEDLPEENRKYYLKVDFNPEIHKDVVKITKEEKPCLSCAEKARRLRERREEELKKRQSQVR